MIGQVDFYTAQLGNGFQLLVASRVTRHGEYFIISCHTPVLLYYLSGNIQQSDIGFRVSFLSSGDNPQISVKECLQVVFRKVLDIGICQTCKATKWQVVILRKNTEMKT